MNSRETDTRTALNGETPNTAVTLTAATVAHRLSRTRGCRRVSSSRHPCVVRPIPFRASEGYTPAPHAKDPPHPRVGPRRPRQPGGAGRTAARPGRRMARTGLRTDDRGPGRGRRLRVGHGVQPRHRRDARRRLLELPDPSLRPGHGHEIGSFYRPPVAIQGPALHDRGRRPRRQHLRARARQHRPLQGIPGPLRQERHVPERGPRQRRLLGLDPRGRSVALRGRGPLLATFPEDHEVRPRQRRRARASWGTKGTGPGQFGVELHGLDTDAAGNVYVADADRRMVHVFTSTGTWLRDFGQPGAPACSAASPATSAAWPSTRTTAGCTWWTPRAARSRSSI